MAKRGILYMVWGQAHNGMMQRSMDSVALHHPDLPIHVERLNDDASLLDKARMFDITPFDETLYLDTDTVVMDNLHFGFDKASQSGLACCICECPWARRYGGLSGDMVEYNTGVLFFTARSRPLFKAWKEIAPNIDSSIVFRTGEDDFSKMPLNDQAGFAKAMEETGFSPFVLPLNWNFRPHWHKSWFGPLKVWHDFADVPDALVENNRLQASPDATVSYTVLT